MKKKAKPPGRKPIGLLITGGIILIILIASTIYFENIRGPYKKEVEKIKETYLSVSKNADIIKTTKKQRVDFFKRRFYIDFPLKYAYSTANFTRKLSLITPKEIELLDMEIKPANQSFTFLLNGRVRALSDISAQLRFREFYRTLERFEDVLQITSSTDKKNAGQIRFYFTINGEAELQ